jgi:hypothetical protein
MIMVKTKSDNLPLSALEAALEKLTAASPEGKVTMSGMLKELASGKAQNLQNSEIYEGEHNGNDSRYGDSDGNHFFRG